MTLSSSCWRVRRSLGSSLKIASGISLTALVVLFAACGEDEQSPALTDASNNGGSGGNAGSGGGGQDANSDALVSSGCSADSGARLGDPAASGTVAFAVQTSAKLGAIVTANGRTLYFYGGDVPAGINTKTQTSTPAEDHCTGSSCLRPFYTSARKITDGLVPKDFAEFTRGDGNKQLTYKGWPVYTTDTDKCIGDTTADGNDKLWHAVSQPFYNIVIRRSEVTEAREGGADAPYEYTYLADGQGVSLYMFWDDTPEEAGAPAVSACDKFCIGAWPVTKGDNLKVVSSLNLADFDILTWTPPFPEQRRRDGGTEAGTGTDASTSDASTDDVSVADTSTDDVSVSVADASTDDVSVSLPDASTDASNLGDAGASDAISDRASDAPVPVPVNQLVYKGWPMYYFFKDVAPGQTFGHCVVKWSLAEISGKFIDC